MNNLSTGLKQKASLQECYLRLLDQSYNLKNYHLGSAFSSIPLILEIYAKICKTDKFIYSNSPAFLSLRK